MEIGNLAEEIVAVYRKHGWQLRKILVRPTIQNSILARFNADVEVVEADFDAIWFSRPSFNNREAWELRALEENPYALFETFAAELPVEERESIKIEMEERLRERATRTS